MTLWWTVVPWPMPPVTTSTAGPVRIITISRPEVKNCIDGETATALLEAWEELRDDDQVAVGVLTGAGGSFCSGADLKAIETLGPGPSPTGDERETFLTGQDGYLGPTRRLDLGKPLIAAVEGYALAGGLELACLADLRIAGKGARFGVTNRRWGVPLVDGGTQRLPRIVGLGRALELILTGRVIEADEAHRIGLVNEVVQDGGALDRAKELAQQLAELPQAALLADRQAVYDGIGRPLEDGLEGEARLGQAVIEADGFMDGPRRFAGDR